MSVDTYTETIKIKNLLEKPSTQFQLSTTQLYNKILDNNEGKLTELGAVNASTGKYTGRSPKDKFIVTEPSYRDNVDWGDINQPIDEAVTVVLAPHYSSFSVGSYDNRAQEEADKYGIKLTHIKHYYHQPKFIKYWTDKINETLNQIPEEEHDETVLIVSAHSLPKGLIERNNDPYPKELHETAQILKQDSNIVHVAEGWQSEGNTGTPWLGPDVQDLTRELYQEHHFKNFIYTPVGFVCEHLEVLYDNDYECKVVCDEIGAKYYRPEMPNTNPLFIGAIVDEIKAHF